MTRESCIEHRKRTIAVVIREDYYRLTNCDRAQAAILNAFEYWANGVISKLDGQTMLDCVDLGEKTIAQIEEMTLWQVTDKQARSKILELAQFGYITIRKQGKYTNSHSYTFNVSVVEEALKSIDWSTKISEARSKSSKQKSSKMPKIKDKKSKHIKPEDAKEVAVIQPEDAKEVAVIQPEDVKEVAVIQPEDAKKVAVIQPEDVKEVAVIQPEDAKKVVVIQPDVYIKEKISFLKKENKREEAPLSKTEFFDLKSENSEPVCVDVEVIPHQSVSSDNLNPVNSTTSQLTLVDQNFDGCKCEVITSLSKIGIQAKVVYEKTGKIPPLEMYREWIQPEMGEVLGLYRKSGLALSPSRTDINPDFAMYVARNWKDKSGKPKDFDAGINRIVRLESTPVEWGVLAALVTKWQASQVTGDRTVNISRKYQEASKPKSKFHELAQKRFSLGGI